MSSEVKSRVEQESERKKLEQDVAELKDSYRHQASVLEHLRQALPSFHGSRSGKSVRSEFLKVKIEQLRLAANRTYERLLDERLSSAETTGHHDREDASDSQLSAADASDASDETEHLAKSKRLQEEYERLMSDLEQSLELLAEQTADPREEIGRSSFELDESATRGSTIEPSGRRGELAACQDEIDREVRAPHAGRFASGDARFSAVMDPPAHKARVIIEAGVRGT